ncbi:MAG: YHS domain-containing (seleno)protein [Planctomycetota bacterium]
MFTRFSFYGVLAVAFASVVTANAGEMAQKLPSVHVNEAGVGVGGYDPVAYFHDGVATPGVDAIRAEHEGVIYQFANNAHRDAFVADPAEYLPQYGGYCAFGVAAADDLFPTDPTAWKIVDGRLFLNLNKEIQQRWLADTDGFIQQADAKIDRVLAAKTATEK